mmetsp:Transcript_72207/g.193096  ORF Transcript_72207/g.193096 Transcript_72207/m.193096 type:complete len:157 (-) Transcript_72207:87-557(-)
MVNLHKFLSSQGFDIIAFPCNQFGFSEHGNSDTIITDIKKFDISFTFMSKVCANGRDTSPVYRFLKAQPNCGGNITWNYRTKCGLPDSAVVRVIDRAITALTEQLHPRYHGIAEQRPPFHAIRIRRAPVRHRRLLSRVGSTSISNECRPPYLQPRS